MPPPVEVALKITAEDTASAALERARVASQRIGAQVAAGMSAAVSGTARWEEGLRRLQLQQQAVATTAAGPAREGLGKFSNALTNLAGNMLGANNQVANMAEGLLSFAAGGVVVTAVAAGVAVVAAAVRFLGKDMREARKDTDAFLASLNPKSALATVGAEIDLLRDRITKRQAKIDRGLFFGGTGAQAEDRARLAELETIYQQLYVGARQAAITEGRQVAEQAAKDAAKSTLPEHTFGFALGQAKAAPPPEPLAVRRDGSMQLTGEALASVLDATPPVITALDEVRSVVLDLAAGFMTLGASIGDTFAQALASGDGVIGSIKAVQRALAQQARTHGAYDAVASISALGRGLFGDPTQFAAAAKLAASSAAWFALSGVLGGGGGGGGARVAGGGAAGAGSTREQRREFAEATSRPRTIVLNRGFIRSDDPDFQDFLREATGYAAARA